MKNSYLIRNGQQSFANFISTHHRAKMQAQLAESIKRKLSE